MITLKCTHCNKDYNVKPYLKDTSKYCSRSCLALASRTFISSKCLICGDNFTHISSRANKAKYCSRTCYSKAQSTKGTVSLQCAYCNTEFLTSPSKAKTRKYCSKACTKKSNIKDFSPTYTTVRKTMLKREMLNSCERCGYDAEKSILGVHHKDRNRKNNSIQNLEVLCPNCHSLEHMKHVCHGFKE